MSHDTMHGDDVDPFVGMGPGTSLGPAEAGMMGLHGATGRWTFMLHGVATGNWRREAGLRGDTEVFHTGWLMAMADAPVGRGKLRLETMISLEPAMGPRGYPLLLQTGETADGSYPLVDRQHPHDALTELAASYGLEIEEGASAFVYAAAAGSPALGPVPYMHRTSAGANPVAPITHHFLDATHLSYGVLTLGVRNRYAQAEVSVFNGREPDQHRWVPDRLGLDSYSVRLTATPGPRWSMQASFGALHEPEQLHPINDIRRVTLSASYHQELAQGYWAATAAWGRNKRSETRVPLSEARARLPAPILSHYLGTTGLPPDADDALLLLLPKRTLSGSLLETSLQWRGTSVFARGELASKDELVPLPDLRHSNIYDVSKVEAGVAQEIPGLSVPSLAVGVVLGFHFLDQDLRAIYGSSPRSLTVFARASL